MSEQLLTFEGIMEYMRQNERKSNRAFRKMRHAMQESAAEFDRRMEELRQQMKRTDKRIGDLGNRIGDMVEHMIGERIVEKFQALGLGVTHPVRRNCSFLNTKMGIEGEFDLTLVDTNVVILISAKLMLEIQDVNSLMEKIEEYRRHIDAVGFVKPPFTHLLPDTRFIGAIAGAVVDEKAITFAHENGIYVIVQSGDAVTIVETPEGFQARQW